MFQDDRGGMTQRVPVGGFTGARDFCDKCVRSCIRLRGKPGYQFVEIRRRSEGGEARLLKAGQRVQHLLKALEPRFAFPSGHTLAIPVES
jgi:hypothetical protein